MLLVDQDADKLASLVASLGTACVSGYPADVSNPEDTKGYVEAAVDRFGRIDVLFSNAGVEGRAVLLADYPIEIFDRVLAVNVRGVFLSLKYSIPVMVKAGGGSVIITSSIAGIRGVAGLAAYSTSKHAIVGMMRSAALEYARAGVRVNTINPAPIDTRMMRGLEDQVASNAPEQARSLFETTIPMGRYGTPREVASIALFLASDESRFCTGGVYPVDGGVSAGRPAGAVVR